MANRQIAAAMLAALVASTHVLANENKVFKVSVEALSEGGVTDQTRLKEKAVLAAKESFPVLVEGKEVVHDGIYSQTIEAATLVFADAEIIESAYDSVSNRFWGRVNVTLDVEKTLSLLSSLKEKKRLSAHISRTLDEIKRIKVDDIRDDAHIVLAKLNREVEIALMSAGEISEGLAYHMMMEQDWITARDKLMNQWALGAQWEVTNVFVNDKTMRVKVTGPDIRKAHQRLNEEYAVAGYRAPADSGVCGVSKLGLHFMVDVAPIGKGGARAAKDVTFEFRHHGNVTHIDEFQQSFEVMPCY